MTSELQYMARREKLKKKWTDTESGKELVKKYLSKLDFISVVCTFSGGRDSLASTLMTLDVLEELNKRHRCFIVFNNTTNEFPETVRYVHQMFSWFKEEYPDLNIKTEETRPKIPFAKIVEDMFYIAVVMYEEGKWDKSKLTCCDTVKLYPMIEFLRKHYAHYVILGTRGDESRLRFLSMFQQGPVTKSMHTKTFGKTKFIRPLWNWGIQDVMNYLKTHPKKPPINPLYDKGMDSIGCCLCPVPFLYNRDRIRKTYPPKIFERGMQLLRKAIERTGQSLLDTFLGAEILLEEMNNRG